MNKFFRAKPSEILDERYDRLAILLFGMVWVFYSYSPDVATAVIKPQQFKVYSTLYFLWIPGVGMTLFYLLFPGILKLETIGSIMIFGLIGVFGYVAHFLLKGFGIIDLSWFGFYYGNIGLILLLRRMQRKMLGLKEK